MLLNSQQQLKQTLVDELQILVGKQHYASTVKAKGGAIKKEKKKKGLTIEEEFLILQQLADLNIT